MDYPGETQDCSEIGYFLLKKGTSADLNFKIITALFFHFYGILHVVVYLFS
jgi:hypothetical protein